VTQLAHPYTKSADFATLSKKLMTQVASTMNNTAPVEADGTPPTIKAKFTSVPRFDIADKQSWMDYLDAQGYVVIANAGSRDDMKQAEDLFWEFVRASGMLVERGKTSTWGNVPANAS
jgi:hypothetical protein